MRSAAIAQSRTIPALLVVLLAAGISVTITMPSGGAAICLAGVLLLLLGAMSRFDLTGLTIAAVASQPLVQFLKRAIFLLGPQPKFVYYSVQGVSTALFLLALLVALRRLDWRALAPSAKLLSAFLALSIFTTLLAPSAPDSLTRAVALITVVLPISAFYIGLALGHSGGVLVARTMFVLVVVSVAYGLVQLVGGPTGVEEAWALATRDFSIQGAKVFSFLRKDHTVGPEFRPFSFYPDHFMWGVFLVCGSASILLLRLHGHLSKLGVWSGVGFVLLGLLLTLSRGPLVAFLAMLGTYQLLRLPSIRRPWLIAGLVPGAFALVVVGGEHLLSQYATVPLPDNEILARFMTVGTLDARVGAWDTLRPIVGMNWLTGQGWAYSEFNARHLSTFAVIDAMWSHNFIVELVLYVGLPGLTLFVLFYLQWIREALTMMRSKDPIASSTARLIVAFSVGLMIFGLLNGCIFMTFEYFLILGLLSGYTRPRSRPDRSGWVAFGSGHRSALAVSHRTP